MLEFRRVFLIVALITESDFVQRTEFLSNHSLFTNVLGLGLLGRRASHTSAQEQSSYCLALRQASTMQNFDVSHANFRVRLGVADTWELTSE